MAFNDALMEAAAATPSTLITHVSLHTTGAVTSSANESAAGREEVTWDVDEDGTMTAR